MRDLIDRARKDRQRRPRKSSDVYISVRSIRGYYADWLADADYAGQSPLTLDGKRLAVEKLLWFLDREQLESCGEDDVQAFLSHVEHGHETQMGRYDSQTARSYKPVGKRTLQLYFVYIRTFFKWLVEEQIAEGNPIEKTPQPKFQAAQIKPLSMEEIEALLRAVGKNLNRSRNTAVIFLLFDSGMRISELCSIKTEMIDLARRSVTVIGKGDKERTVYFSPDTAKVIRQYLTEWPREAGQALFYSERSGVLSDGLTPDGFRKTLKRLADKAGIDPKRVSPHKFRHSFATEWLRDNGNARALQIMLGHTDMKMTDKYVTFVDADAQEQHREHSPIRRMKSRRK